MLLTRETSEETKYYTGVGSRKTPWEVGEVMIAFARAMAENGLILRSGGAKGADLAFEGGAGFLKETYRPEDAVGDKEAHEIAGRFHPLWHKLDSNIKLFHARNVYQVLGAKLCVPSEFLICWTPDGCIRHSDRNIDTGGTGTAISVAELYEVPIINIKRTDHIEAVKKFIDSSQKKFKSSYSFNAMLDFVVEANGNDT